MTDVSNMVIDDRERGIFRVDRHSFVDSDVFEAEKRRIFDRVWLYVGHEMIGPVSPWMKQA